MISTVDPLQRLRHGAEHHLHSRFRGGDVVVQQPLPRHAQRAVAVEPDAVQRLRIQYAAAS